MFQPVYEFIGGFPPFFKPSLPSQTFQTLGAIQSKDQDLRTIHRREVSLHGTQHSQQMRTLSSGFFVTTQKGDDSCWRSYFVHEQRYWNSWESKECASLMKYLRSNHRILSFNLGNRMIQWSVQQRVKDLWDLKKQKQIEWASWWLNQPIWKIWYSQIGNHLISPTVGMKIKNIWVATTQESMYPVCDCLVLPGEATSGKNPWKNSSDRCPKSSSRPTVFFFEQTNC